MRPLGLPLARHVGGTLGGALDKHGLRDDAALVGLLFMLVEDTVHSTVDRAPLVNAALGITIRGAGLTRATGGMHGFWKDDFTVHSGRWAVRTSALPVSVTADLSDRRQQLCGILNEYHHAD